jgi:hypothetical protein
MKWTFKPIVKDGFPVQAEAILDFKLNTRAWGPASPLSDAQARKLASNTVEPIVPPGIPAGTIYNMSVAVDSEGRIIEEIAPGGPSALFKPCMDALGKWQFKPLLENGEPRPYRATITFVVH